MTTDAHRIHGHDELSRLDILRGCRPFIKDSHQAALQVEQTACCRRTEVLEQELARGDGPIVQGRTTRIGRECIDDAVVILRVSTPRSAP